MQKADTAVLASVAGDPAMHSPPFTEYYRNQLAPLFHSSGDWETFETVLRLPLPVSFRFTGWDAAAHALRDAMETEHATTCLAASGQPLPWYPGWLAWQFDVSRVALKHEGGSLRRFWSWLVAESELGRVMRQEAVSMVPPLLLAVQRGDAVLDLCASPGSKTMQILEMLEAKAEGDEAQRGLLVANDADYRRANCTC